MDGTADRAFQEAVESLHVGFLTLDRAWRFTHVNRRAARNVGYEPEALVGRVLWDLFPSLSGTAQEAAYRRAMDDRVSVSTEVQGSLSDAWYELDVAPTAGGIAILWTDITARKQAEAALREGEAVQRAILDAASESIWLFTVDGVALAANRTALVRWGGPPESVLGTRLTDFLPGDLARGRLARLREVAESGKSVSFDDTRAGIAFEHTFCPVVGAGGRVDRVAIFSRDVTERRRVEAVLRRYELLARHGSDIVLFVRRDDWRIVEANAAAVRAYGHGREALLSLTIHDLRAPAARPLAAAQLAAADAGGTRFETVHRRADGSTFPVEVSSEGASLDGTRVLISVVRDISERRRAEEALRQSDARFRLALRNVPVSVAAQDLDLRFVWAFNQRTVDPAAVLGKTDADLFPPEDAARLVALKRRVLATGEEVRERLWITSGGRRRFLDLFLEPTRDADGRISGIGVASVDLTEMKLAEEALRESEQRSSAIHDQAPFGIALVHMPEGRLVSVNDAFLRLFGLSREEALGRTSEDLGLADAPSRARVAAEFLEKGEVRDLEVERTTRGGERRTLSLSVVPVTIEGNPHSLTTVHDVTEQQRALLAQARLAAIVEGTDDAVISKDLSGVIQTWNAGAERLYGYRAGEAIGRPAAMLVPPDRPGEEEDILRRIRAGFPVRHLETRRLTRDGGAVDVAVTASPILDAEGKVVGASSISRDIGERLRAAEALREANARLLEADRRKDDFLTMLSHELRNPLAPIRNAIYVLDNADPVGEASARARGVVRRQAEHLSRLVDDLLDVARIARGRIELRRGPLDLRDMVQRAADDLRAVVEGRGVSFEVRLPTQPAWTDADATRLAQVIGNLVHNAAKFTRPGDRVTLALAVEGAEAELSVTDTGAGIEAALLPGIFDAFVQGERTLARSEGGLGLGLALVKGIVELHGGTVSAHSRGKGQGAELRVRLPLDGDAPATGPAGAERVAPRRRRVLIADDNVDGADSLAQVVEMLGHVADVAYDGPEALERARARPPDVVLCDIGLPGMTGYEVARALRADGIRARLVALSGYAQPGDVQQALAAGFDSHVAKPVDVDLIAKLLE